MNSLFMEQEESGEHCGDMWDVTGRGLPKGCGDEAPESEEKPKEEPPFQIGLPGKSAWRPLNHMMTGEESCPLLLWPSSIRGPSSVTEGT